MPGSRVVVRELRAEFLTASVIPVLLAGAVVHFETALFDWPLFLLTLFGAAFLHIGTNVINDYFDHLSGNDPVNIRYIRPFTGGSRLIQDKLLTPKAVLTTSLLSRAGGPMKRTFLMSSIVPTSTLSSAPTYTRLASFLARATDTTPGPPSPLCTSMTSTPSWLLFSSKRYETLWSTPAAAAPVNSPGMPWVNLKNGT